MTVTPALLESLIAQRRRCHGSHANGNHPHGQCKRCRRAADIQARQGKTP